MTTPFFSVRKEDSKKVPKSPDCERCKLYEDCASPKMKYSGKGEKGVLVVAEAPGEHEDLRGTQLVGMSGQFLRTYLLRIGVDIDRDCWKTNAVACRPMENRKPTEDEIKYCRPNVNNAIQELNPKAVIVLGSTACQSVVGPMWKEGIGGISVWEGFAIPSQMYNSWIHPTYHPSFVMRAQEAKEFPVIERRFAESLKDAFCHSSRPWEKKPDYRKHITVELNPDKAAKKIEEFIKRGLPVSFDYETTRLKPDFDNSEIYCCAVTNDDMETIAFPWVGKAVEAMSRLLKADNPKVGANAKFEERWTRAKLGHSVSNWVWDTMLMAHVLDSRRGVTSVKFQALVKLGISDWSSSVKKFFTSVDDEGCNSVKDCNLEQMLEYCGMDSLVEHSLYHMQLMEAGLVMKDGRIVKK